MVLVQSTLSQITISFFFATVVLKQKHVDEERDECFIWIKRKKEEPEEQSERISMASLFRTYSHHLLKTTSMVLVAVITLAFFGFGAWKWTKGFICQV